MAGAPRSWPARYPHRVAERTGTGKREKSGTNGRVTARSMAGKAGNRRPGRYTPPIPRYVRRSPPWFPYLLLSLLLLGVVVIILNYMQVLPASPTNWYTLGGMLAILSSAVSATYYH